MSNFLKSITASALLAVTGIASAASAPNIAANICTTNSWVNFRPAGETTKQQLTDFIAHSGCYTPTTHDASFGVFANGAAIQKVDTSTRLVRLVDASGETVGHAAYAFTLIPMVQPK